MSDLVTRLSESTWIPKARRDSALHALAERGDALTLPLLEFALATRQPEAVNGWIDLVRNVLPRDAARHLTKELLEHVVTISGARTVKPAALRAALDAVVNASDLTLPTARAALLALGTGVSLANAHGIYVAAARKAQKSSLPREPPHLAGPIPELSVFETVELTLDLARLALEKAPHPEGAALVEKAEHQLAWHRNGKHGVEPTKRTDEPATAKAKGPGFALARAALMEARNIDHVSGRGTSIKSGVMHGLSLGDEAWWLREVDEALMRADARTAWERRNQRTSRPITHLVWRGGDASTRLWLARLEDGTYALLAKLGRTWSSSEGDLETVAATLPDAWFARAMSVVERRK